MRRSTDTENMAYSSFRCMTSVQRGTGKGRVDWGQTLKGLRKKKKSLTTEVNHWSSFWCGVSQKMMMLNRNAKENAGDDGSFGRSPRMIHTAQDYDHKI